MSAEPVPANAVPEGAQDSAAVAETSAEKEPDYFDQLLRLKAEFENFRKRTDREKPEFFKMGRAEVVAKLLPIYDVLRQAHQDVIASHNDAPLAKGMEGIFKEFEKLFKEEGVTVMDPIGKPYDALKHEVLGTAPESEEPEGTVVDVLQTGFMLEDKVLRTAKVRIAKQA